MDMTSKDIAVIKAAVKSRNKSKFLQPILFAMFVAAVLFRLFGLLSGDDFSSIAVPLLLIAIFLPQLGGSPKYNQLVDILEKQLPKPPTVEDFLSEELKKHNKAVELDS